jgi:hypothetical protein
VRLSAAFVVTYHFPSFVVVFARANGSEWNCYIPVIEVRLSCGIGIETWERAFDPRAEEGPYRV